MKKLNLNFIAFASIAAMALTGCSTTVDVKTTEKNLTKASYTVVVQNVEEYAASITGKVLTATAEEGFKNHLKAVNQKDFIFTWYFNSIDSAEAWWNKKMSDILSIQIPDGTTKEDAEMAQGYHNNVVYYGTAAARDAAKLKV